MRLFYKLNKFLHISKNNQNKNHIFPFKLISFNTHLQSNVDSMEELLAHPSKYWNRMLKSEKSKGFGM